MRLLNVQNLEFCQFHERNIPAYAIASHRWIDGAEVNLKDVTKKRNTEKSGYKKIEGYAEYIKANLPSIGWLWIDTCCVDQKSSQEVSEAINSMFRWYNQAAICLVYLADVDAPDDVSTLSSSDWFRRGWTLQELLSPRDVLFLTRHWQVIGHKGSAAANGSSDLMYMGPSIVGTISTVTRIPRRILEDYEQIEGVQMHTKLGWMVGRDTTRPEDASYCLLGLLDVSMPIIYGEGGERARRRLLEEAAKESSKPQSYQHDEGWRKSNEKGVQELEMLLRTLGEEHPKTLEFMNKLAIKLRQQGQIPQAKELAELVSGLAEKTRGPDHPDTLIVRSNLAQVYWAEGRWDEAVNLQEEILEAQVRVSGETRESLLTSGNLALSYVDQARYDEAEHLQRMAVESFKSLLGVEHPDTIQSMHNLSLTFSVQGRLKEAEELMDKVVELKTRVLGLDHEDTAATMNNLALAYWDQGRWREAEVLQVRVLETWSKIFGPEHPKTLIGMNNLATTYMRLEMNKEAADILQKVVNAQKELIGDEHPDTLRTWNNLAVIHLNIGELEAAESIHTSLVEKRSRILGAEHPDTASSIHCLALIRVAQQRGEEAAAYAEQAVLTSVKALGLAHPTTLLYKATLAMIHLRRGNFQEAQTLSAVTLGEQEKALGPTHPNTLQTLDILKVIYEAQGKEDKATQLEARKASLLAT